ncbi:MAG: hypothetical protein LC632_05125 [Xanthomonadaceae bacterium]|nr:hypothetical protein [Xanthomonadaceae bacterium]
MKWITLVLAAALAVGCNSDFDWMHYEPQAPVGNFTVYADDRTECRNTLSKSAMLRIQ